MIREIGRVALRLAGAGVVGTAIGAVARRAPLTDVMDRTIDGARAIGALPVWETAGRFGVEIPMETLRQLAPVLALTVLGLALAAVAAWLWRRAPQDGDASPLALDLPALAALLRRPTQRRATPARAGLVPTLAATGVDRAEIARRTGLSRDAVALSLNLAARQV